MKKNSNYWVNRIANETYKTYNSLEEKNRALIDMFQEATLDIENELYTVGNKIRSGRAVTLSDMHKYNRLTNLKKSMEDRLELLTKNVEEFGTTNIVNGGKKVYNNVIGNIADTSFSTPNQRAMEEMLNKPWNGSNFSRRLWKNTQVLANNLNDILTIGLTQGKTLTELAVQLRNRMNKSFNECHRLVRTETMHYLNESAFRAYKDGGCEEVELYAAEDERTCEICGKYHSKKYKLDKRPILPFHPNCRCTYLPVISEKKKITNSDKDGIIKENNNELFRKDDNSREEGNFISDVMFDRLTIKARKAGAIIVRGTEDAERHLDFVEAAASIVGDVLIFRKKVLLSDVIEETYHFEQNLVGLNDDKSQALRTILNEIDAKEYLIKNAKKYKIPRKELETTKKQLESYKKQLKNYEGDD